MACCVKEISPIIECSKDAKENTPKLTASQLGLTH